MRHIKFADAHRDYIKYLYSTGAKSRLTIEKEDYSLAKWSSSIGGHISLRRISVDHLRDFAQERSEEGVSNRTINLDVVMLGNLLDHYRSSLDETLITAHWKPLKHSTPRRSLMPTDTLAKLLAAALATAPDGSARYPNGRRMADFLRLLAYSGCRKQAALSARWSRVDWVNRQITFQTKFDKWVTVDMGCQLEAHLRDMLERKNPDSDYLFPSPDLPEDFWSSPDDLFTCIRADAGLQDITFHDFRHAFISRAMMAGVDTLTVARWVGHADGGVLIGKVYGHLNSAHLQASAAKLNGL